jgi:polyisoprenoid-binding protein YceI
MRALTLLLLAGLAAAPLAAPLMIAPTPALAQAAVPSWTVDKAASTLGFRAGMSDGGGYDGKFEKWDAVINFDPANLGASKVVVTIDTGSVTIDYADAQAELPDANWLNVAKFPTALFVTKSIKSVGANKYEALGDLKILDVTREVTLPFTLTITGDTAKMDGAMTIDRTKWGLGKGKWTEGDFVNLEAGIKVQVVAKRK